MGLIDAFNPEDRVEIKISDLFRFFKETAEATSALKYIENAVRAGVPNTYILGMLDGIDRTELGTFHWPSPMFGEEINDRDGD